MRWLIGPKAMRDYYKTLCGAFFVTVVRQK
jgi:hypothetical protein